MRYFRAPRPIALVAVALTSLIFVTGAAAANVAFPNNGWKNPAGSATYETWGFGKCGATYVPGFAHLGADSHATAAGTPVTTIGDGVVSRIESGWPGQAVGVAHTARSGQRFIAVYGHLVLDVGIAVGVNVSSGQRLGVVLDQQSNSHVHFGLRPILEGERLSTVDLRGNSRCKSGQAEDFGYVNPIRWLESNLPKRFGEEILGKWRGNVEQPGVHDFTVQLRLRTPLETASQSIRLIGICAGTLQFSGREGAAYLFDAQFPTAACLNGKVRLVRSGSRLRYRWNGTYPSGAPANSRGSLKKVP